MIHDLLLMLRRAARMLLSAIVRVIGWLLWPLRWLARTWWRLLRSGGWVRRSFMLLGTALLAAVVVLAVAVPWPGYLFTPPFRAVEYAPINDRQWAEQGWSRDERLRFYYHPQGSAQVMLAQMRYAWFVNLERPFGTGSFCRAGQPGSLRVPHRPAPAGGSGVEPGQPAGRLHQVLR